MFVLLYLSKHKSLYLKEVKELSNTIKGVERWIEMKQKD